MPNKESAFSFEKFDGLADKVREQLSEVLDKQFREMVPKGDEQMMIAMFSAQMSALTTFIAAGIRTDPSMLPTIIKCIMEGIGANVSVIPISVSHSETPSESKKCEN